MVIKHPPVSQLCLSFSTTMAGETFVAWPRDLRFHPKPIKMLREELEKGSKCQEEGEWRERDIQNQLTHPFLLLILCWKSSQWVDIIKHMFYGHSPIYVRKGLLHWERRLI